MAQAQIEQMHQLLVRWIAQNNIDSGYSSSSTEYYSEGEQPIEGYSMEPANFGEWNMERRMLQERNLPRLHIQHHRWNVLIGQQHDISDDEDDIDLQQRIPGGNDLDYQMGIYDEDERRLHRHHMLYDIEDSEEVINRMIQLEYDDDKAKK